MFSSLAEALMTAPMRASDAPAKRWNADEERWFVAALTGETGLQGLFLRVYALMSRVFSKKLGQNGGKSCSRGVMVWFFGPRVAAFSHGKTAFVSTGAEALAASSPSRASSLLQGAA